MRPPRAADAVLPAPDALLRAPRTYGMRYLLRRYARNRLSLIGMWVVLLIGVTALFAPWLAPYDPTERVGTPFAEPSSPSPLGWAPSPCSGWPSTPSRASAADSLRSPWSESNADSPSLPPS